MQNSNFEAQKKGSSAKKSKSGTKNAITKMEYMKRLREPPPSRPAFTNDGKNLNLENHSMLL